MAAPMAFPEPPFRIIGVVFFVFPIAVFPLRTTLMAINPRIPYSAVSSVDDSQNGTLVQFCGDGAMANWGNCNSPTGLPLVDVLTADLSRPPPPIPVPTPERRALPFQNGGTWMHTQRDPAKRGKGGIEGSPERNERSPGHC
jgi:hypothetical protein